MTRLRLAWLIGLPLSVVTCLTAGCAQLVGTTVLTNHALVPGTESSHPALIDGSLKTSGESTFDEAANANRIITPPSEAFVFLPKACTLTRVVIHSSEIVAFDLYAQGHDEEWRLLTSLEGQKGPTITVPIRGIVRTSGVRLRIRKTSGDAAQRQKSVQRTARVTWVSGDTRVAARIYEIELLGPAPEAQTAGPAASDHYDEIGQMLIDDLK